MATPNVLVRTHYYETGSKGREFYSSSERNDYLDYVEKGIKVNREIDYLDYAGDGEKSSGVFTAEGITPKAEMKELRKALRETKSCIWDCVVSFEEGYGKRNVYDWIQAKDLLNKTLPAFFRSVGLDPDNVVWYAGLHTNTDNRHIHLSFFEKEPRVYDKKAKAYRYRKGKLPMARVADLKMAIEKAYLSPVEGAKRVRRLMEEGARKAVTGDICRDSHSERVLLRKLYEEIPQKGDLGYESENMDGCRGDVDALNGLVLSNSGLSGEWERLQKEMEERDAKTRLICQAQKIPDPEPYLYAPKFKKDLRRRMGNAIIKEIVRRRGEERKKALALRHPKAVQKNHIDHVLMLIGQAVRFEEVASNEAADAFDEFEAKLAEAERERKLEEGEGEMD